MKVQDLVKQERAIMSEMEDLMHSIKKLRTSRSDKDNEWLIDIEKDERPSVKLLYQQLKEKEAEYDELMNKDVSFFGVDLATEEPMPKNNTICWKCRTPYDYSLFENCPSCGETNTF